jgi:hypothetical protein
MKVRHQKVKIWMSQKPKTESCQKKKVNYCPAATKWEGEKKEKKKKRKISVLKAFELLSVENIARKLGLHINQGKTKYMIVEWKNS